jgi:hypothetical protein
MKLNVYAYRKFVNKMLGKIDNGFTCTLPRSRLLRVVNADYFGGLMKDPYISIRSRIGHRSCQCARRILKNCQYRTYNIW